MSMRIGLAGCGSHALGRIVPLLEASADLSLVAVWTRNPTTQAQLRERGIKGVYSSFKDFLATDMDVVYIASPSGCHCEHAAAVLRSGRHAWVEKPLVSNISDARELVALAARSGRMLAECFMFTWHEQAQAIRQTLAQGLLGELRLLSLTFCFPHLSADNFRYDPALGGGAWLDHGCYLVKALDCYFPGEWDLLGGSFEHGDFAVDISGAAQLRRASDGLIANLNWGFGHSYVNELQVIGARGRMLVESAFTKPAARSCNILLEDSMGQRSTLVVNPGNSFASMLEGFTRLLGTPACWEETRQEILAHAEHFFALQHSLKQANTLTAHQARPHAE
jgi:dTDP-3,4-didehydro-2,6-dideoxy-alpha-D-glucose 3-reductase